MDDAERGRLKARKKLGVFSAAARAVLESALDERGLDFAVSEGKSWISFAVPVGETDGGGGIEVNLRVRSVERWCAPLGEFLDGVRNLGTEREAEGLAESLGLDTGGRCHLRISKDGVVRSCAEGAFHVRLGADVREVGDYAFWRVASLRSVRFCGSTERLMPSAFEGCANLRSVVLPASLREIGFSAFEGCTNLRTVVLPGSLRKIGFRAFEGAKIASAELPDGVLEIGARAFAECRSLEKVRIPPLVPRIAPRTFASCEGLRSVELGASVGEIGDGAFQDCGSLERVALSPKVRKIPPYCFFGCKSLSEIELNGAEIEEVGESAFSDCGKFAGPPFPNRPRG